jgi:arylsulfatase A-like enzyme
MYDLFPTFLELAGLAVPPGISIDGKSLVPLLLHQQAMPAREFFWKCGKNYAARDGKWKLTIIDGKASLFDLSQDLGEKTNLAASQTAIVAEMTSELNQWKTHVGCQ